MTQYIDKDALVAEIKERRDSFYSLSESCEKGTPAKAGFYAQAQTLEGVLSFINTLEVKEVDLEKEIHEFVDKEELHLRLWDVDRIAKHFFELGLKAQKGG